MNEVNGERDGEGQYADEGYEKEEELESDPAPGGVGVTAPHRSDDGLPGEDEMKENELQAGAEIKEKKGEREEN